MEENSKRLDHNLKRNIEQMNQTMEKLNEERRREDLKDKEINEQHNSAFQRLQEITKKVYYI